MGSTQSQSPPAQQSHVDSEPGEKLTVPLEASGSSGTRVTRHQEGAARLPCRPGVGGVSTALSAVCGGHEHVNVTDGRSGHGDARGACPPPPFLCGAPAAHTPPHTTAQVPALRLGTGLRGLCRVRGRQQFRPTECGFSTFSRVLRVRLVVCLPPFSETALGARGRKETGLTLLQSVPGFKGHAKAVPAVGLRQGMEGGCHHRRRARTPP